MQSIDVEQLATTGDRDDFLATYSDNFGVQESFILEITHEVPTPQWLQGHDLQSAARALAEELGASDMHSKQLAGRRFRFSTYTSAQTLAATVMLVRSNGSSGLDAPNS